MKKAILATKIGMTQIFDENGVFVPVTVLQAGPCSVVQVKTVENDGYNAIQVGFGDIRETLVNKPLKGHFAKAGVAKNEQGNYETKHLKEFRLENAEAMNEAYGPDAVPAGFTMSARQALQQVRDRASTKLPKVVAADQEASR